MKHPLKPFGPLALACFLASAMQAQISARNIENFKPGDHFLYQEVEAKVEPGPGGAKQTWDFSHLKNATKKDTIEMKITTVDEDDKKYYPKANILEKSSDGTTVYFEKTDRYARVWSAASNGVEMLFTQPYDVMLYPSKYKDTIVSKSERTFKEYGGYTGQGHTKTTIDGWGTLVLPSGTYKVLRVVFEQNFDDISDANSSLMRSHVLTYAWFDETHAAALLKMDIISIKSPYYTNTIQQTKYMLLKN